jgi:glycosyltransferase involved in cell wall biosynthesis
MRTGQASIGLPKDAERPTPEQILPDDLRSGLARIGRTDVLVGIPCFNSARTVGHVVTAVEIGLRKFFPDLRSTILLSDGGSTDGTIATALRAGVGDDASALLVDPSSRPPEKIGFSYRGIPGKGSAFRAIFEAAREVGASACAVVDSDLRSITPAWLDRLISPVARHGYHFVAPMYARHRFDGTITNSIAYPVTTALYGTRLRQPIGGDFGFSGELAARYAAKDVWESDVARFGVDIWMTTVAVVEGHRVCQASLGAKLHDPKDPGKDLGPMFRQVVGSLFALAGQYRDRWSAVDGVVDPPTFGLRAAFSVEPVSVSLTRLTWKFIEGYVRHESLWREVMSEETMSEVVRSIDEASERQEGFRLDGELWIRIVYEFLIAYNRRRADPELVLDSLIPLYFARTASYVQEVAELTNEEAETAVDSLVDVAVRFKPYLERGWQKESVPERSLADQPVGEGRPVEELAPGSV